MLHKPDTEIFLFPTENAKSELMTTILLAAFMTLCIGILTWKQRVTNQNAHNMGSRNFMSRITFIFGVAILLAFGCGSDRISKRIQPHDSDLSSSSKQPNGAKYPLFIASDKDTFYSLGSNFPSGKGEYFEDIYLLTGQYKLDRLSYPCIEVRSIDNKRIVVYHFDSTSTNTFVYQKHDNYWLAKYFSKGDTCEFYTFKYLLPEREIEFNYTNKEATWFSDITVTDQNRETIYVPVKGFSISPELKNIDSLKNNYDYKHETILSGNANQMKLRTLRTRKDGVKEIDNTECYPNPGKQHSLLWWELFAWTLLKRIDCHSLLKTAANKAACSNPGFQINPHLLFPGRLQFQLPPDQVRGRLCKSGLLYINSAM